VSYKLSKKEAQAGKSPSDKIERLIDEAKRAKTETDPSRTKEPRSEEEARTQRETPATKRTLREEILVTLNETSKELSRIIGVLIGEREAPSTESQIIPRYCSYCGRDVLPNALYCDRCGASVKGA